MTEYEPYGVRHFLRDADAEGASELRRRPIPLAKAGKLEKGDWGTPTRSSCRRCSTYRTLVLRRIPAQSRPPVGLLAASAAATTTTSGSARPAPTRRSLEHLPLGDFEDPARYRAAREVQRLAPLAGPRHARRRRAAPDVVASLSESTHPEDWIPTEPAAPT